MYGLLSTTVWILLVSSSILGYHAHHLIDDLPTPGADTESDEQRTPIVGGSVAIPLQEIQPPNAATEECSSLNTDEPASVTTLEYFHTTGRVHARTMERVADWLRWIGKSLAIVNAIGIIANSMFQYASVYDNCYCDSSVYTWGLSNAFDVISPIQSDFDLARKAWIGALALSLTSCTFFVGTIYLIRDSLPSY